MTEIEILSFDKLKAEAELAYLDVIKRSQDIRYTPLTLVATSMGAGAALVAAIAGFLKIAGV